ncbi:hypothetical protein SASPL_136456 [Salvia splendens]|uniref:Uncharacterized protein n=1 Tax=Salvia splendens TaxID=180675 RepID=A0A8X8X1C6_SALSN|nr:hypothetical protein SASPL_136456 [Salvia splendens]
MESFGLEESALVRRCASSLVASDVARATSYERLSQSMRLVDEGEVEAGNHRCKRNRSGWRSLLKLFSHKKKQETVETKPPNKRKVCWVAYPHRRWPVQGW